LKIPTLAAKSAARMGHTRWIMTLAPEVRSSF
jgi:hypothetical protein